MIFRGDSNDSNHSSVGDIPIELPHLEDEDDMYNIHVFNKSKKSLAGEALSNIKSEAKKNKTHSKIGF